VKNLRREIGRVCARHGRSLGYRPIHARLVKEVISCTAYLVRKVMKDAASRVAVGSNWQESKLGIGSSCFN